MIEAMNRKFPPLVNCDWWLTVSFQPSPQSAIGLDSSVSLPAVDEGLDADILNLLNHESFGSSPASSWASPVSPTTQLDVPQDVLLLSDDKPMGLDADLTPTIRTNEADIMAQYLNDDFFGMMDH